MPGIYLWKLVCLINAFDKSDTSEDVPQQLKYIQAIEMLPGIQGENVNIQSAICVIPKLLNVGIIQPGVDPLHLK